MVCHPHRGAAIVALACFAVPASSNGRGSAAAADDGMEQQLQLARKNAEARWKGTNAAGRAFLLANQNKDGVLETLSGLQYRVIRSGNGTAHPLPNTTCSYHYEGRTAQEFSKPGGKVFDSSIARGEPVSMAPGDVIHGCAEAMEMMVAGDKWELYIPSHLAYGEAGAGKDIRPGDALVFTVELLSLSGPGTALTNSEMVSRAACKLRAGRGKGGIAMRRSSAEDIFCKNLQVKVACTTTAGDFTVRLTPSYSPLGVARFLMLVQTGFFTDQLLYRVTPGFLVQFGVAADPNETAMWDWQPIEDEPNRVPFRAGTLSFAGPFSAHERRSHLFVALEPGGMAMGAAPHETTLGHVDAEGIRTFERVAANYKANGYYKLPVSADMQQMQQALQTRGNVAAAAFPKLDRIQRCTKPHVVRPDPQDQQVDAVAKPTPVDDTVVTTDHRHHRKAQRRRQRRVLRNLAGRVVHREL